MSITTIIPVPPDAHAGKVRAMVDAGLILQTDGHRTVLCDRLLKTFRRVDSHQPPVFNPDPPIAA